MYRRILLPLDGSDVAQAALPHAEGVAAAHGAELVLLRVVPGDPAGLARSGAADDPVDVAAASEEAAGARAAAGYALDATRARLEAAGLHAETHVVEGAPGPAIVDAAEALACDLIVMATHGRSGIERTLVGSVSSHVVAHAGPPVLLVRPDA